MSTTRSNAKSFVPTSKVRKQAARKPSNSGIFKSPQKKAEQPNSTKMKALLDYATCNHKSTSARKNSR